MVVVLVAVAEAVNVLVAVAVGVAVAVAEAVNVLVPMSVSRGLFCFDFLIFFLDRAVAEAVNVSVILSRRRLFCFDFGIKKSLWFPRCRCCFGYEKETEGKGKWMALFRDLIF